METETKYKVQDLIDAIKKNRIKWNKNGWFKREPTSFFTPSYAIDNRMIEAACVLGVGAINLGVDTTMKIPKKNGAGGEGLTVLGDIMNYNDGVAKTWEQARDYAVRHLTPYSDRPLITYPHKYTNVRYLKEGETA